MQGRRSPRFSVVMPIFNKGPHIQRSVSSVLSQTLDDFELLAIDDASTDDSLRQLSRFSDHRIHLLHRSVPGPGGYAARNLGISKATGEWIAFLDADDMWFPDHLLRMSDLAKNHRECQFLSCGWKIADSRKEASRLNKYFEEHSSQGAHEIKFVDYLKLCLCGKRPAHTSVVCIKNNALACGIFPEGKATRGGDLHAWLLHLSRAKTLAWSPHVGGKYFVDSTNMVTRSAPTSLQLPRLIVVEAAPYTDALEMRLLKRYSNRRMVDLWLQKRHADHVSFNLASALYWKEDFVFCISRSMMSLIPDRILNLLYEYRRLSPP